MSLANYETNIMKLSQSNDAVLEVAVMGDQETDKAVVLLHGAIMNYKIMTIFAKYIHDAKLIFINCPGRGGSTSLERQDYDLSEYARRINEALVNIVKDSNITEMSMIGYSMGGLIATKLAGYNTLPIKHLIYLNSAAKIDYKELRFSKLLYEIMKDVKPGEQNEMINSIPEFVLSQGVSKNQKAGFNFSQYFAPVETMITDLMYTLRADYLADIDQIKEMPKVLFLLGEDDVIFPNKDSKMTHEKFETLGADVQSIIYPDVGHLDFLSVLDDSSVSEQDSMTYHINQLLAE